MGTSRSGDLGVAAKNKPSPVLSHLVLSVHLSVQEEGDKSNNLNKEEKEVATISGHQIILVQPVMVAPAKQESALSLKRV